MNHRILLSILAFFYISLVSAQNISKVWVCDDGERILQDDISNTLASNPDASIYQNGTIKLYGLRNEIVAFQLIIQADINGVSGVNVSVSDLKNGASTYFLNRQMMAALS